MRRILVLALPVCLAACSNMTSEQEAKIKQVLQVACNVDGVVVPVAQKVVTTMGEKGTAVANADLLVHPEVVEACKAISGTPVSATPVSPAVTVSGDAATKPAD